MKHFLLILITIIATSCKSLKQDYIGSYKKKGHDYTYILELNTDSTFVLIKKYYEYNSECKGKWNVISQNFLLLNCDEEDFPAQMTMGYMGDREYIIKIINSRKIKLDKVIMKKSK